MRKSTLQALFVLLVLVITNRFAVATTYTIPAGTGTLNYNATVITISCQLYIGHQIINSHYYHTTYSSFLYNASGATVPLTGTLTSTDDPTYAPGGTCPPSDFSAATVTGAGVEITFTPSGQTGGTAVYEGFINPKYVIVGVMYSPPGNKSTVTYGSNTVVGNSSSITRSFKSTVGESVSDSTGFGIAGFLGAKQTITESNSYIQEQDSSSSIAFSQTTSASTGLTGYSDPLHGVNHDYDYIFVWLNAIEEFTVSSVSGKTQVQWTGYGYDLDDTPAYPDMDIIGIQLGCLNGNFYKEYVAKTNTNWATCETIFNNNFNRSWALKNADGSSPALTPTLAKSSAPYNFCQTKGTDLYALCQADPFANPNYIVQFASGSITTTDGRFTACNNSLCNATIEYQPNVNKMYSQGYSTTLMGSQTAKYTYMSGYSVEDQFTGGASMPLVAGGPTFSETMLETFTSTYEFSEEDQFNKGTNSSNGQTASFAIVGPPEGYKGPQSFVVYQDNLYGVFMFYPD